MDSQKDRKAAILADSLTSLWAETDPEILAVITAAARDDADAIADTFYRTLEGDGEAAPFLDHAVVQQRLRPSLAGWIRGIFCASTRESVEESIARNYDVGLVHARINIPLTLVNAGMRIIKKELSARVVRSNLSRSQTAHAVLFVGEVLDTVLDNMHEAYLGDLLGNVRHQQSLKMFMTGQNLALEGERLKSSLFDWLRNAVVAFYAHNGPASVMPAVPPIETSDFGLWLTHKAELIFGKVAELDAIRARTDAVADAVRRAAAGTVDAAFVRDLNDAVTEIAFLLGAMIEKALEIEGGRDPLTRLLTRRFMPAIFQREVTIALRHGKPFAVLLMDADHFKQINDTLGHQAGDTVLTEIAELVHANVRAGDFVFRYGGEEFLVLLTEMDMATLQVKAERLRILVAEHRFTVAGRPFTVTASIGAALHDGHPDYEHTVRKADAALYEAKRLGRNRVVIAGTDGAGPAAEAAALHRGGASAR
ncbi:GGDEF domain-containing protein [Azospirillum halopraeferens]|uniref:GGDEF domain-containing protein n=1 Tax=Azospirillum halopraeferens TaxID=34010 RepID=UPI0004174559|nr:GGDEF domain-containing protein [Azospirillum halopraeferens]